MIIGCTYFVQTLLYASPTPAVSPEACGSGGGSRRTLTAPAWEQPVGWWLGEELVGASCPGSGETRQAINEPLAEQMPFPVPLLNVKNRDEWNSKAQLKF